MSDRAFRLLLTSMEVDDEKQVRYYRVTHPMCPEQTAEVHIPLAVLGSAADESAILSRVVEQAKREFPDILKEAWS